MVVKSNHLKINVKESEFVLKNDISKIRTNMGIPKLKLEKKNLELESRQFLKSNDIKDFFRASCQNRELVQELGITIPISYRDIPVEMEDYRKDYCKFIDIVNEYIHNVEQSKKEKNYIKKNIS